MLVKRFLRSLLLVFCMCLAVSAKAALTVDVLSLTLPARTLPDLNLPGMDISEGLKLLPFYFQVNYTETDNINWAIEIFSNNRPLLGAATTPDSLYRGLRGDNNAAESIPLYWQVYADDQHVPENWGTPASVTATVGGLGLYPSTLNYWGEIFDRSDIDKEGTWNSDREERFVATVDSLGEFPRSGRTIFNTPIYLYFGADLRNLTVPQPFRGNLTIQLENFAFDFSRGCFATPNPVKPVRGERVYFNFYTNNQNSGITIKVFDPTGFPVKTIKNSRYWDCRNDRGHFVEGGLYLYQIEVEDHVISGTVVVIK